MFSHLDPDMVLQSVNKKQKKIFAMKTRGALKRPMRQNNYTRSSSLL